MDGVAPPETQVPKAIDAVLAPTVGQLTVFTAE